MQPNTGRSTHLFKEKQAYWHVVGTNSKFHYRKPPLELAQPNLVQNRSCPTIRIASLPAPVLPLGPNFVWPCVANSQGKPKKLLFFFSPCVFWICYRDLFAFVPLDLNFTNPKSMIFERGWKTQPLPTNHDQITRQIMIMKNTTFIFVLFWKDMLVRFQNQMGSSSLGT